MADDTCELLTGECFLANPRRNHRQIGNHHTPIDCIFFYWKKLDCSSTFAQRFFFPPQTSVDQAKYAQCWAVIWLGPDDFLLSPPGGSKSRPRLS